jgi:hypothetical protein
LADCTEPGWYFFYPSAQNKYECEKFVKIDQDAIDDGWLRCRKYAGTYMGPITPLSLPNA